MRQCEKEKGAVFLFAIHVDMKKFVGNLVLSLYFFGLFFVNVEWPKVAHVNKVREGSPTSKKKKELTLRLAFLMGSASFRESDPFFKKTHVFF